MKWLEEFVGVMEVPQKEEFFKNKINDLKASINELASSGSDSDKLRNLRTELDVVYNVRKRVGLKPKTLTPIERMEEEYKEWLDK